MQGLNIRKDIHLSQAPEIEYQFLALQHIVYALKNSKERICEEQWRARASKNRSLIGSVQ